MFHARHLITQVNLGILKSSKNNLRKSFNYSSTKTLSRPLSNKNSNTIENSDKNNLETIIRIDHTETEDDRRIKLSEDCIKRLKELGHLKKYLRVSVDSGGCSGFEYKFSLDSEITKEDQIVNQDNCKIIIDTETIEFIKGSTIDYHEELIKSGFRVINNPNSEQACSCGTSFSLKI